MGNFRSIELKDDTYAKKREDSIVPKELLGTIGKLLLFALILIVGMVILKILISWNIPNTWDELCDIVSNSFTNAGEIIIYAIVGIFYLIFITIKKLFER